MSINMADVKQIMHNVEVPLYKRTFYFTSSDVVYKNTTIPCPVAITIYSQTQEYWDSSITTVGIDFYNYLMSLGYEPTSSTSGFLLVADNPYEFEYVDGNDNHCPFTSIQIRYSSPYAYMFFSVPGATSTIPSATITMSCTEWTLVGNVSYDFYVKRYTNLTSGSYTQLLITKSVTTGDEYIYNYVINGVSYPNVTITSVSGTSYTLSDNNTYTVTEYPLETFVTPTLKEVVKIQNTSLDVLWQKPVHTGTYTATLSRQSYNVLLCKSNATLISEISTSTGIPEADITLGTKTYNIAYYRASTRNPYIALKNYSNTSIVYCIDYTTTTGLKSVTFDTTDNISRISGFMGNSSTSQTTNFSTSYVYFRAGDTYQVVVQYTY